MRNGMLGVMVDCSRNAVMNLVTVKKFAQLIKKMGYNTLLLYTEDTYEVDNQPMFGHLRGKYTKAELKELDNYCVGIGIELVPCIQTLAHLNSIFKWSQSYGDINDCDDIILVEEEKTYELIKDMIRTAAECFTSRKIHVGMDEAHRVGMGKYMEKHGIQNRFDIINKHLQRVCDITYEYGFEPMVWGDMFENLMLKNKDIPPEKVKEAADLPENITLVYWDYYSPNYCDYLGHIERNKLFDTKVCYAGGTWTWQGFAPRNDFSIITMKASIAACEDSGVSDMFFTMWGDDGAECSMFAALPSLMFAAEKAHGNNDMDSIKAKFKEITGCEFDSFMLFDKFNTFGHEHRDCISKAFLYNDVFMGIRNFLCKEGDSEGYRALADEIKNICCKGEYKYLFDFYESLANVLSLKCSLGIRTRKAYLDNDKTEIRRLADDYSLLVKKLEDFHGIYQSRWFKENKPHGFDVQDIRIGGLIQRIKSCRDRLLKYLEGGCPIPEIEEPAMEEINGHNHWSRLVSANVITHML